MFERFTEKAIRVIMKSVTSNEQKNVGVVFEEE